MEKCNYLMLKTHNKTGLKYLCFHRGTDESCVKYKGSGLYWKHHIKIHGADIHTEILEKSLDQKYISERGLYYSKLWDIVESSEFANIVPEDANQICGQFHSKEARERRRKSLKERIERDGLTDLEIRARNKGISSMHKPENREKARIGIINNYRNGISERRKKARENYSIRMRNKEYTKREIEGFEKIRKIQDGKTMRERLNDPNWVHPNKGKKFREIYKEGYQHPTKGKKIKDIKGYDYISPLSKPFKIIVNHENVMVFTSESDFSQKTKLTSPMLRKLRKNGHHIIKKLSNSIHVFNNNDYLEYVPISIKECKIFLTFVSFY